MRWGWLSIVMLILPLAMVGCGPSDSEAVGMLKQLKEDYAKSEQKARDLETKLASLQEQNLRLQTNLAAATKEPVSRNRSSSDGLMTEKQLSMSFNRD